MLYIIHSAVSFRYCRDFRPSYIRIGESVPVDLQDIVIANRVEITYRSEVKLKAEVSMFHHGE